MRFPHNKIIVFEGLDNCFKETNFKSFVRSLSYFFPASNIETESFPRYGNQSCTGAEKWLSGALDRDVLKSHPIAVNSLYSIDRLHYWFESVHGMKCNIDRLYEDDDICFIFDRYNISNAIYNPLVGKTTTVDDLTFDNSCFGIPQPDIVIWLRNSNFDLFLKTLEKKSNKDKNETNILFLKEIWERSEQAIHSNIFQRAGITLIIQDIVDSENPYIYKTERELAQEIWVKIEQVLEN